MLAGRWLGLEVLPPPAERGVWGDGEGRWEEVLSDR